MERPAHSIGLVIAGILMILAGVVGAVLLLALVQDGEFRPDYLLVGSIPVAIAFIGGGLLLGSQLLPEAVRGTVLSRFALVSAVVGWILFIMSLSFAVLYQVSGGPLTINPFWWWLLPVGLALVVNSAVLGVVGLVRRWRFVPSLLALIVASLPIVLVLVLFLLSSVLVATTVDY